VLKGLIESKQLSIQQHVNVKNSISLGKSLQLSCKKRKDQSRLSEWGYSKDEFDTGDAQTSGWFPSAVQTPPSHRGPIPFPTQFFFLSFTSYGSTCCSTLMAQISDPPSPPAFGYTSSLSTQSSPATPSSCLALFSSHWLKTN